MDIDEQMLTLNIWWIRVGNDYRPMNLADQEELKKREAQEYANWLQQTKANAEMVGYELLINGHHTGAHIGMHELHIRPQDLINESWIAPNITNRDYTDRGGSRGKGGKTKYRDTRRI